MVGFTDHSLTLPFQVARNLSRLAAKNNPAFLAHLLSAVDALWTTEVTNVTLRDKAIFETPDGHLYDSSVLERWSLQYFGCDANGLVWSFRVCVVYLSFVMQFKLGTGFEEVGFLSRLILGPEIYENVVVVLGINPGGLFCFLPT